MRTLRSIWAWFAISALILLWVPVMFVVHLFDRDPGRYRTGRWFRRLGAAMTRANPAWRIRVSGKMLDDPRRPYLVVGNHQSNADIPVYSRLPWDMKWVGKASLFKLPILGWMMRISRDIPVDRSSRMSRARVMAEAKERLSKGSSVMIMPEGTRSRDGRVGRFNDGAFHLAIKLGTPVVPIAVEGTSNALPSKDWRFGRARNIRLHVFEPIEVAGMSADDTTALADRVRLAIIEKVAEWRGVEPYLVDALQSVNE